MSWVRHDSVALVVFFNGRYGGWLGALPALFRVSGYHLSRVSGPPGRRRTPACIWRHDSVALVVFFNGRYGGWLGAHEDFSGLRS